MKFLKLFLLLFILFNLYLCAYPVLHNDIVYNEDVARDLLILQNITTTHKLTLIGPRTEAIGGLYHGPLWSYINLPAFIIGQGNPVIVGWFWIILIGCLVYFTYFVGKKVANPIVGLLAAVLISIYSVQYANMLLNPFGAVLISPIFFYYFYKYVQLTKVKYLLISFFLIGLLIQFEVAFGGPILVLTIIYLIPYLYKQKKLSHFLSILILLIPLSSYILFDIRHNFLQLHSVISHVGISAGDHKLNLYEMFQTRFEGLVKSLFAFTNQQLWLSVLADLFFVYVLIKVYINKKIKHRQFYFLFTYFYLGYWPLSFYINGYVLTYHVLPFLPIALIIFSSSALFIRKELFLIAFLGILFFNLTSAMTKIDSFPVFNGRDLDSWTFNYKLAKKVFSIAPSELGYYVFNPDELGYGPKYALTYTNKEYPNKTAYPYIKKNITFIILAPASGGLNNNREWWIKNRVKIDTSPVSVINYANGYKTEKFLLTEEEIKVPSDPNLVNGLFFR